MSIPNFLFGDAVSFAIRFVPPLDTTNPNSTITWGVVDASGAIPDAAFYNRTETVSSTTTSLGFNIAPSVNQKTTSGATEFRYARVSWEGVAGTFYAEFSYTLITRTPISISTDDVRGAYGMNIDELPDDDINLAAAVMLVRYALAPGVFDAALVAGDQTTLWANNAVKYRAAIELLPSLRLRVAQMAASDSSKFQRFNANFEAIAQGIQDAYDRNEAGLLSIDAQIADPLLFTMAGVSQEPFLDVGERFPDAWRIKANF